MRHAALVAVPLLARRAVRAGVRPGGAGPARRRHAHPRRRRAVADWGTTHADYPATDIFARCGAVIVSPVDGVVVESRRVDSYDRAVDDPATCGGRSVAIVGDDGVRYYLAHFETIDDGIEPGVRVAERPTARAPWAGRVGHRRATCTSACRPHVRARSGRCVVA